MAGSKLMPEFVAEIGSFAYLWAWPLVNVYGFGVLNLAREPVVVQVPDFGEHFFVIQATD